MTSYWTPDWFECKSWPKTNNVCVCMCLLSPYTCGSSFAFCACDLAEVSDFEVCPICRIRFRIRLEATGKMYHGLLSFFFFLASMKQYFKLKCLAVLNNDSNPDTMLLQFLKWLQQLLLVFSSISGIHASWFTAEEHFRCSLRWHWLCIWD